MKEVLHISDVVKANISGDWGEDSNIDNSLIEVACVRGADINDVNGCNFKDIPIRYITKTSLANKCIQAGDIIIEKSGGAPNQSTGRVAYISRECKEAHSKLVCSNFCEAFSVKSDWDSKYIFYYLQFIYNAGAFFNFEGKTSGIRNLDVEQAFRAIPIKKLDIELQRKAAEVLTSIDKKIALNNRISADFESLARLIYNYWFVQFDFPDANGKPYKSAGGKMVYNEKLKREIPEGWEVKKIEDILGRVKTTPKLVTDEYLENGKYPIIDQTVDVYFAGFTDREEAVVQQYPVVVFGDHSCAVKYVDFPFVRGADGTQILISNDKRISTEYLYFAVQDVKMIEGYARHFSFLKESLIIVPEQSVATAFKDMAQNWFKSITQHRFESLSLTRQRDELLPLLMNGQVTVE